MWVIENPTICRIFLYVKLVVQNLRKKAVLAIIRKYSILIVKIPNDKQIKFS